MKEIYINKEVEEEEEIGVIRVNGNKFSSLVAPTHCVIGVEYVTNYIIK